MLMIDMASMLAAVSSLDEVNGLRVSTAFLNRRTGEIVFVHHFANENGSRAERSDGVDSRLARDRLEGAPDAWLEIPKYYGTEEGADAFVRSFLLNNGVSCVLE